MNMQIKHLLIITYKYICLLLYHLLKTKANLCINKMTMLFIFI